MSEDNFSRNETVALMHENTAMALRSIAYFIEKFKMDYEETCKLLREIGDELDAQSIVVEMRDTLLSQKNK